MRGRTQTISGRRKNTPNPPTNPPERSPSSGDHRLGSAVLDHDGPSVRQEEDSDSMVMHVVREQEGCVRDGCEAAHTVDHLYTMDGMSDDLKRCVRRAAVLEVTFAGVEDFDNEEVMCEYVAQNIEIVDHDDVPVLAVRFGDGADSQSASSDTEDGSASEDTYGYWYPTTQDVREEASGSCYGRVDEATRLGI